MEEEQQRLVSTKKDSEAPMKPKSLLKFSKFKREWQSLVTCHKAFRAKNPFPQLAPSSIVSTNPSYISTHSPRVFLARRPWAQIVKNGESVCGTAYTLTATLPLNRRFKSETFSEPKYMSAFGVLVQEPLLPLI